MDLKKLKEEIEYHIKGVNGWKQGSQPHEQGLVSLKAIKHTVEAFEGYLDYHFNKYKYGAKKWEEIKELLNTNNSNKKNKGDNQ